MSEWYYRIAIPYDPKLTDTCIYHPTLWGGTMDRNPEKFKVLLYDDRARFLVSKAWGDFVPPEVTVITKSEADKLIAAADTSDVRVFVGAKIQARLVDRMTIGVVGGEWMKEAISGE